MKRIIWGSVILASLAGLGIAAYFALGPGAGDEAASGAGGAETTESMELTDANFSSATGSGVVMVDFWSPRCPPCRTQGPIVDRLAKKFAGRATVGKLNVDENPKAAGEFNIRYIPTLVIFKDGKVVKRFTGLQQEPGLTTAIEGSLTQE